MKKPLLILILFLTVGCSLIAENWELVKIISRGEELETVEEMAQVRFCTSKAEDKSVSCSAGTSNDLTLGGSLQGGGSLGAIIAEGRLNVGADVAFGIGFDQNSGETLALEPPPDSGYIYHYPIKKTYHIYTGQMLAQSSRGAEQPVLYTFKARCSLELGEPLITTCDGTPVESVAAAPTGPSSTDAPIPTPTPEPTDMPIPMPTPEPTDTSTPSSTDTPIPPPPTSTPHPPPTATPEALVYRPLQVCPFYNNGTLYLDIVSAGETCIPSIPLLVDGLHETAYQITDPNHDLYKNTPVPSYEQDGGTACNYYIDASPPPSQSIQLTLVDHTDEGICRSPAELRYTSDGRWLLTQAASPTAIQLNTITRTEVENWDKGTTDWDTVYNIIYAQIHPHPGKTSFSEGDVIPRGAILTSDLGIQWTRYRPNIRLLANDGGGWGVFETLSAIQILHADDLDHPVGGEYWIIDE